MFEKTEDLENKTENDKKFDKNLHGKFAPKDDQPEDDTPVEDEDAAAKLKQPGDSAGNEGTQKWKDGDQFTTHRRPGETSGNPNIEVLPSPENEPNSVEGDANKQPEGKKSAPIERKEDTKTKEKEGKEGMLLNPPEGYIRGSKERL